MRPQLGAAVIATALFGCGYSNEPERPRNSSRAEIAAVVDADYKFPVYWYGRRVKGGFGIPGGPIAGADAGPRAVSFDYEPVSCDTGCWYNHAVSTSLNRAPAYDGITPEDVCWIRIGKAWLLGCEGFSEGQLYTGRVEVYLFSDVVVPEFMARQLKPLGSSRPAKFEPPKPFSCRQAGPPRFRKLVPRALRPRRCR